MKISIVTAVLNRAASIRQSIESVRLQSSKNIEHIIIDGASTDGTVDVINGMLRKNDIFVSEPDNGIYDAINKGISIATGDIVGVLHSDDFFADGQVLKDVAARFKGRVNAVYGDLDYVSASNPNRVIRHWVAGEFASTSLIRGWMPPHPTLFLRREVFENLGLYDTQFSISADYDAVLRYFNSGDIVPSYIPRVLVKMRVGGKSNQTFANMVLKNAQDLRALRRNGVGGFPSLLMKNIRKIPQFAAR